MGKTFSASPLWEFVLAWSAHDGFSAGSWLFSAESPLVCGKILSFFGRFSVDLQPAFADVCFSSFFLSSGATEAAKMVPGRPKKGGHREPRELPTTVRK